MNIPAMAEHVDHFRMRVVQDALSEATAAYWLRRAAQFESAAPRDGDYPGKETDVELNARLSRLSAIAQACRNRASISLIGGEWT